MTDKVQKIRAFLVGIADSDGVSTILAKAIEKKILPYIDSLQEEPVSEDLEKAAIQYAKSKHTDKALQKIVAWDFEAGAKWHEKQLMANATEVTVHIEAGNYPYIPQMELYNYDKDIPLAKEGDKYKVVLIKED